MGVSYRVPVTAPWDMRRFEPGDRVRVDIPDESDPDFAYHGEEGEIVEIIEDDAGFETGDERDSYIFVVELDAEVGHFRWRDLRPAMEE